MPQPTTRQRRQWIDWYFAHGEDGSATCAHWGIHRSTLSRWLTRYAAQPTKPLRAQSRRPHTTRQSTWSSEELLCVCALLDTHPTWGRGRVTVALRARTGTRRSEATVGRLLAHVRERCPVCDGRDGRHNPAMRAFRSDLAQVGGPAPTMPRARRARDPRRRCTKTSPTCSGRSNH